VNNLAELRLPARSPGAIYLGPAAVVRAGAALVDVELENGVRTEARLALAFSYEPAVGDTVLVLGTVEHYVVGVLASSGRATLSFPGDLELRAVGGTLRLTGDRAVTVDSPKMQVQVGKLEIVARSVMERFFSLTQHVVEMLNIRAGQSHTVVDGSCTTHAESATLLTKDKVTINGRAIHLG
jgi:hypothetical protein